MPNKPDTVLRTQPTTSATADLSQSSTNLSSATGGAYETSSARTAIGTDARAILVRFDAATGESGMLVFHGSAAGTSYGYRVDVTSDALRLVDDTNGVVLSIDLPGVDGTADTFSAQFCTRANPLTTGASDAFVTEGIVYNETDSLVSVAQATHADATVSSSENISIGGYYDGTATLASQYSNTIREARIGSRWHSTAEFWEDYGTGETSSGTGAQVDDPLPPVPASFGSDAEFAGPAYLHAGAQVRAVSRRLLSPIVNYYNPQANYVGGWHALREEVNGTWYDATNAVAGFADGPNGATDRGRDFEYSNNNLFVATDSTVGSQLISGTTDFWISCRVKWESFGNTGWMCAANGGSNGTHSVWLGFTTGSNLRTGWAPSGSNATAVTGSTTLSTGTWYHIAALYTHSGGNRTATLYIDGVSDGSGTLGQPSATANTVVVGGTNVITRPFDGVMTELKIEPMDETSSSSVSYSMSFEAGLPTGDLNPHNPIAWWRMHQPSDGYAPARNYIDVDLGGSTYKAHAGLCWRRPVPPMADRAEVRVICDVQFRPLSGVGSHDEIVVAVVSSTKRPGQFVLVGQATDTNYTTATISSSSSSDEYVLEFSTDLDLARDPAGMSNIYVATRMESGSPTGDTWISVKAVHVTPYAKTPGSSLPLAPGA